MTERKFIVKELDKKDFFSDDIRVVKCWYVNHTDEGGWTEGEITFHFQKSGNAYISGESESYGVILTKEQAKLFCNLTGEQNG